MGRIDWEKEKKRRLVHERGFEPRAATARWNEPPPESDRKAPFAAAIGVGRKKAKSRAAQKKACQIALSGAQAEELKLHFFHAVARADLRGQSLPGVPKKLRPGLEPAIREAGGVLQWARRQPDYAKIRKQQEGKLDVNAAKPEQHSDADEPWNGPGPAIQDSIERLVEAQRSLRDLLVHAESELQRIDREIVHLRRIARSDSSGDGD